LKFFWRLCWLGFKTETLDLAGQTGVTGAAKQLGLNEQEIGA